MGRSIPLTVKEKFVAMMASRDWTGNKKKGQEQHLLYFGKYEWNGETQTGTTKYRERTPAEVRRLLSARKNHTLYDRARKFVDETKKVTGFSNGTEARLFIDEWRTYGDSFHERMLIFFIDAEDLAEGMSDAEMEARLLAEAL